MGLFENKVSLSQLMPELVDRHSHILPGVDDGFAHTERSLAVLHRYQELGVKEVWLTPHIMEDCPNKTDSLRQRFEKFQSQATDDGITIPLHLAAENMLDPLFLDRLADGDLLTYENNMLLVETSYFNPPMDLPAILDKILEKGYTPVLAHPERYTYMLMEDYPKLKEKGIKFQLNISSFAGVYGPQAKEKAIELLKSGSYEFLGTDLHRENTLDEILKSKVKQTLFNKLPL